MPEAKLKQRGRPKTYTVHLGLRISPETFEKLERNAAKSFRSKSQLIEKLVAEHLP